MHKKKQQFYTNEERRTKRLKINIEWKNKKDEWIFEKSKNEKNEIAVKINEKENGWQRKIRIVAKLKRKTIMKCGKKWKRTKRWKMMGKNNRKEVKSTKDVFQNVLKDKKEKRTKLTKNTIEEIFFVEFFSF